jgi:tetratricopeptide (TPR) repeat protein
MSMNELQILRCLDQARAYAGEGLHLHAAQLYRRVIADDPRRVATSVELAALYEDLGLPRAALGTLIRAEAAAPGDEDLVFLIGSAWLACEQAGTALRWFRKLEGRRIPEVHFNMGLAHNRRNDVAAAEREFRRARQFGPQFPHINEYLGEMLIKRGAFTEAVETLRRGITADPYSALCHHLLGLALVKLRRWYKAYRAFITAVDLDPGEPAYWQMCAESLLELKRSQEAEAYLRKSLELAPQSVDTLVDLGHLLLRKGELDRGQEFIGRALEIDRTQARAREARWTITRRQRI